MNPRIIACDLHDYIEIACLYGYRLRLYLRDQQTLEGKAVDIISAEKREYLVIENGKHQSIDLMQLTRLEVLTPNAKFSQVNF